MSSLPLVSLAAMTVGVSWFIIIAFMMLSLHKKIVAVEERLIAAINRMDISPEPHTTKLKSPFHQTVVRITAPAGSITQDMTTCLRYLSEEHLLSPQKGRVSVSLAGWHKRVHRIEDIKYEVVKETNAEGSGFFAEGCGAQIPEQLDQELSMLQASMQWHVLLYLQVRNNTTEGQQKHLIEQAINEIGCGSSIGVKYSDNVSYAFGVHHPIK